MNTENKVSCVGSTIVSEKYSAIKMDVFERRIFLKIPKNLKDIAFIRSLSYSKWDNTWFHWVIPNYPGNLDLLKTYFQDRIDVYTENLQEEIKVERNTSQPIIKNRNEVILLRTTNQRLRIIFGFNQELLRVIKKIPYNSWDAKNKWWSIPYSEVQRDALISIIAEINLSHQFIEEQPELGTKIKRISEFEIPNYKKCPPEFLLKLKELRYSVNTEKVYKSTLEDYLNYHYLVDLDKLNEGHIRAFLRHLVMERNVSISYEKSSD